MSNEMIAMMLQFLILVVFAVGIRSVNNGKPGKSVPYISALFCVMFTLVIYVLDTHTLIEVAPFVRDAASVMWSFIVDGFVSLGQTIKGLM